MNPPPAFTRTLAAALRMAGLSLGLAAGVIPGAALAAGAEPIRVTAQLVREPAADQPLCVEFRFETEPGVHVYAAASHFFGVRDTAVAGLGPATMTPPPTVTIPDLLADQPGTTVPVFSGTAVLTVTRPAAADAGAAGSDLGGLSVVQDVCSARGVERRDARLPPLHLSRPSHLP